MVYIASDEIHFAVAVEIPGRDYVWGDSREGHRSGKLHTLCRSTLDQTH